MSKLNGYAVLGYAGSSVASKVPGQTESSLTLTANTEDVTTKDSPVVDGKLYPEEETTTVSAELQMTAFKEETAALGLKIGEAVKWGFVSGGDKYSGDGNVTSITHSGSVNGKATVQITVKSKGKINETFETT